MTTVTIRECKTNGQRFVYRSRASDAEEAIARAVKARYGTKAWFKQDHGLADGYGVVLVPTAQPNAYSVVSPRVLIEVV